MYLTIGGLTIKVFKVCEDEREIYFKNIDHKTGEAKGAFQIMDFKAIGNVINNQPRGAHVYKATKNAAIYWRVKGEL